MILIGIGANLPSERFGTPVQTCEAALSVLDQADGIRVVRRSRWFESAPVPMSDQPWYVNGACIIETQLDARAVLGVLHSIETDFGRIRAEKNAARVLDLDLLAYDDFISSSEDHLAVPHPRLHERAFVLLPLQDLVPGWVHPQSSTSLADMIDNLPDDQIARAMETQHHPEEGYLGDD